MVTSSECDTEQTSYVEPDHASYDAIDAAIDAEELEERRRLDPLVQATFDELAWMKSDDAQVQYRKDMLELEHWREKYARILPDLEELEERRKVEREAQAELVRKQRKTELELRSGVPFAVSFDRNSSCNAPIPPKLSKAARKRARAEALAEEQQSSYFPYHDPRATHSYCNRSCVDSDYD